MLPPLTARPRRVPWKVVTTLLGSASSKSAKASWPCVAFEDQKPVARRRKFCPFLSTGVWTAVPLAGTVTLPSDFPGVQVLDFCLLPFDFFFASATLRPATATRPAAPIPPSILRTLRRFEISPTFVANPSNRIESTMLLLLSRGGGARPCGARSTAAYSSLVGARHPSSS